MAIRIDLPKETVLQALDKLLDSHKRAANTKGFNPLLKEIYEKEIAAITTARNTLTETK